MFVGRRKELDALAQFLGRPGGAAIVYGRRGSGKSALVREAMREDGREVISFQAIKTSIERNTERFASAVMDVGCWFEDPGNMTLDDLPRHAAIRFPQLCREYFRLQMEKGSLDGATSIGTWRYERDNDINGYRGCTEYEIALQKGDGIYVYIPFCIRESVTRICRSGSS